MTAPIDFFIFGTPAPGGSKSFIPVWRAGQLIIERRGPKQLPFPVGNMVDAGGDRLKEWRDQVRRQATAAFRYCPLEGPLRVCFAFVVQRPQNHHRKDDRTQPLKDWALDHWPASDPDTTKLIRGTEDELSGILWRDDSQIVQQFAQKRYAGPGERTGCRIVVTKPIPDHIPDPGLLEAACSR